MALHEDEENTNADIIQDVRGEVEETAEEESIPVTVNLNEVWKQMKRRMTWKLKSILIRLPSSRMKRRSNLTSERRL
jgi:hypothetical protein